jgi:hypothetical protein
MESLFLFHFLSKESNEKSLVFENICSDFMFSILREDMRRIFDYRTFSIRIRKKTNFFNPIFLELTKL